MITVKEEQDEGGLGLWTSGPEAGLEGTPAPQKVCAALTLNL